MGPRDDLSALACTARKGESFKVTGREKPAASGGVPARPHGTAARPRHRQEPQQDRDRARQLNTRYPALALGGKAAGESCSLQRCLYPRSAWHRGRERNPVVFSRVDPPIPQSCKARDSS